MNKYLKESIIWVIMVIPFIYLSNVWATLPATVPIHFGIDGNADGWLNKNGFVYFLIGLIFGLYLLFLLIPNFDPKKKIEEMGEKYNTLRLVMALFFSALACFNIYITMRGSLENPGILVALLGVLYTIMGNYTQTFRPNYFLGIRTPWTLENENVWKQTHLFASKVWVLGGIVSIIMSFLIHNNLVLFISFISLTALIVIIPTYYSYVVFKKLKQS